MEHSDLYSSLNANLTDNSVETVTPVLVVEAVKEEVTVDVYTILKIADDVLNTESAVELLKYQYYLIKFLRSKLDDIVEFKKMCGIFFDRIIVISEILMKKSGQKHIVHKNIDVSKITRSSYKFCERGSDCPRFYDISKKKTCTSHHFVHNILLNDILSVAQYFKNTNTVDEIDRSEVYKSINTIDFVITRLHNELYQVDYASVGKSEELHNNSYSRVRPVKKDDGWEKVKNKPVFQGRNKYVKK